VALRHPSTPWLPSPPILKFLDPPLYTYSWRWGWPVFEEFWISFTKDDLCQLWLQLAQRFCRRSRKCKSQIDWLIDCLRFYVPLKNFSLVWRRHHCRLRAAKFRPMLGAQGLWAGRNLYRATPTVTRDLGFSSLIRRTSPISRLLRQAWGCGGSILTRILTGQKSNRHVRQTTGDQRSSLELSAQVS
jgi:hypothetical protein